jgi:hypothetical protein
MNATMKTGREALITVLSRDPDLGVSNARNIGSSYGRFAVSDAGYCPSPSTADWKAGEGHLRFVGKLLPADSERHPVADISIVASRSPSGR